MNDNINTALQLRKHKQSFKKNFDFRFLMDLDVLGCTERDLTIFENSLSVCVSETKILWLV